MTRKQFVKRLMARGWSKHEALDAAQVVVKAQGAVSYEQAFADVMSLAFIKPVLWQMKVVIKRAVMGLAGCLTELADSMRKACETLEDTTMDTEVRDNENDFDY